MTSPEEKLRSLLKPLQLEKKQGCTNKAVVGGLDRFIVRQCEDLLRQFTPSSGEFGLFLKGLHRSFTQYLTLTLEERERLLSQSLIQLTEWSKKASRPLVEHQTIHHQDTKTPRKTNSLVTTKSEQKPSETSVSLNAGLLPFIPKEKLRAFQLTHLKTVDDLLRYSPKWALQNASFTPIAQCANREEPYFIKARINGISQTRRGRLETIKVNLEDGTGHLSWIWFNRFYLKKELVQGRWVILHETPHVSKWGKQATGKAETYEFLSPEEEAELEAGKTVVFYPSTATLTQQFWRGTVNAVLDKYESLLPKEKDPRAQFGNITIAAAIFSIHRPASLEDFEMARKRLAFAELLTLQTFLMMKRKSIEKREKGRQYHFEGERILKFRKSVPYPLTGAQKKVVKEIREDLAKPYPMNRLLQGDVGSGKTLVAAISFLYAADSGVQSAFMAPTEILAHQHYQNLQRMLEPVGLKMVLLTSDMKAKAKREVLKSIETGKVDLAIGTHALLEDGVRFKNLGFLVIDERHKFGVMQRAALEVKGKWPDCLMMTATPFPRALVLTEYGDTDLSLLDEFPKGRKSIKTFWKSETKKDEVYQFAKERVLKGEQVFWVFPVVDESKNFLKSAIQMHQHFKNEIFHGFRVGLLHGKMKKEEKEAVMKAFAQKEIQILVATTVVEVGVDIANATIMVVEHAERFGLAQLHQLRGRVGRGADQSYCFLLTSPVISSDAIERMKIMASTLDGFKLSEFDLKMRGPGEIFGVSQSGRREGGIVDLKRDVDVVEEARKTAQTILEKDPRLVANESRGLRESLQTKYRDILDLAQIS